MVASFGLSGVIPLAEGLFSGDGDMAWMDAGVKEGEGARSSRCASARILSSSWRFDVSPRQGPRC
jgi:hypothetical protein